MTDYDRIAQAIEFLTKQVKNQPTLADTAAHLHMSPYHFQRIFSRWAGVTPKRFLQILTVERAKQLLSESISLLEVSDTLGLSSSSRLYDHFVTLEAVTPGEYKTGGEGICIRHSIQNTPFGKVFIAMTDKGICKLAFVSQHDTDDHLSVLTLQWPQASFIKDPQTTSNIIKSLFSETTELNRPLSLHVSGTNFQLHVWRALLQIPAAGVKSYSQIATEIGRPRAARAVGSAVAANPVAFLIPCHRVIQQSGKLGGYHWGETRLNAIHAWESARDEKQ